jgi:hypothetical protein
VTWHPALLQLGLLSLSGPASPTLQSRSSSVLCIPLAAVARPLPIAITAAPRTASHRIAAQRIRTWPRWVAGKPDAAPKRPSRRGLVPELSKEFAAQPVRPSRPRKKCESSPRLRQFGDAKHQLAQATGDIWWLRAQSF